MNTITKQQFKNIWKKISNDQRRKPTFEEVKCGKYDWESKKYIIFMQNIKTKGFIFPEHHIIYNIIRGFSLDRGFQPESIGYLDALNFFKDNHNTYKNNKIYLPFKDFMSGEEFSNLIEQIKYKIKTQ